VLVTTTPSVEGRRITRYCGVVCGEAILGANIFKDMFAGLRDIVGGRSGTYEKELQRAREIALKELEERAALALRIDRAMREHAPAGWKGDETREKQVLNALFPILSRNRQATLAVFEIIKNQPGY
jgi:hypothetical protein